MTFLTRTVSGNLDIRDSVDIAEVIKQINEGRSDYMLPPDYAVSHLPKVWLDEPMLEKAANGCRLKCAQADTEIARYYCGNIFLGLAAVHNGYIIPKVILYTPKELI